MNKIHSRSTAMTLRYFLILLLSGGLAACAEDKAQSTGQSEQSATQSTVDIAASSATEEQAPATTTDTSSGKALAEQLSQAELPENAPEIGTAIEDVIKPVVKKAVQATDTELEAESNADEVVTELKSAVNQIMWKDLIPDDYKPEKIMQKYQAEIQEIEEGTPEERVLMKKMMAEFDNAPSNEKLHGKKIKIPGFVSPLDQSAGVVGEFLLVPYFGSCIHSPPPPVNQTILVKPEEGKSIAMNDIYEPVWVTGYMKVEGAATSLAEAGYIIEGAQLEKYTKEDEANR